MDHDEHIHSHEHTHADGTTHTHEHSHEHAHSHDHEHPHLPQGQPDAQTVAVLQYMLEHNIHHASELNSLAASLSGEAQHQLLHAVEAFDEANGFLSAAVELIKKDAAK